MLSYIASHARRCNLKEVKGKRSMVVTGVPTVSEAVTILKDIEGEE